VCSHCSTNARSIHTSATVFLLIDLLYSRQSLRDAELIKFLSAHKHRPAKHRCKPMVSVGSGDSRWNNKSTVECHQQKSNVKYSRFPYHRNATIHGTTCSTAWTAPKRAPHSARTHTRSRDGTANKGFGGAVTFTTTSDDHAPARRRASLLVVKKDGASGDFGDTGSGFRLGRCVR